MTQRSEPFRCAPNIIAVVYQRAITTMTVIWHESGSTDLAHRIFEGVSPELLHHYLGILHAFTGDMFMTPNIRPRPYILYARYGTTTPEEIINGLPALLHTLFP